MRARSSCATGRRGPRQDLDRSTCTRKIGDAISIAPRIAAALMAGACLASGTRRWPSAPSSTLCASARRARAAGRHSVSRLRLQGGAAAVAGRWTSSITTLGRVEEWMRRWAREKPDLVQLYTVGLRSAGARSCSSAHQPEDGKDTTSPRRSRGRRHSARSRPPRARCISRGISSRTTARQHHHALLDHKAVYIRPLKQTRRLDMYRLTRRPIAARCARTRRQRRLARRGCGRGSRQRRYIRGMRRFVGAERAMPCRHRGQSGR